MEKYLQIVNAFFAKLPFRKLAEAKVPAGATAKFPLLGKAIPYANQIACGLAFVLLVACIGGVSGCSKTTKAAVPAADIDSALIGNWKDNIGGLILTMNITKSGITWGGMMGSELQTSGDNFAWIAKGGKISYKYSGSLSAGSDPVSLERIVYTYTLNGGNLELYSSGKNFVTMVKY